MRAAAAAILALLIANTAPAQTNAALGQAQFTDDTDGFHSWLVRGGALFNHASYLDYKGVAVQTTHYSQSGWSRDVPGIVGLWRDQQRDTLAGFNVEAGIVQVAGHTRPVGDATWGLRPLPGTGVELIAAGGLVETKTALDRGIAYTLWGVSAEQALGERFTAIGLVGAQPFTDGNDRIHVRARLIWDALPEYGITAQLRWRQYESRKSDVGGAYFNPDRYSQWLAGIGVRQRRAGWLWTGTFGAGEQDIKGSGTQPSYLAEIRGEGSLAGDIHLAVNFLYSRAAAFSQSPGYWYGLIGATLIAPF
ncbi:MAG: hypothetical protein H0T80_18550 [Betaproteobacteria bacterium]|nr:hypothetical protein [Betaproteobacteria bacterium]